MSDKKLIRINKFLSEAGFCSRRKADEFIEKEKVTINNILAKIGDKVSGNDTIKVSGKTIKKTTSSIYLAFNKPIGIVCTTDKKREKNNIISYINYPSRIFPIGRLDKFSEGLIILTNDGDIVNKILRARNNHEKEYEVIVNKPITKDFIKEMSNGVPVLNVVTRKCLVKKTGKNMFNIILTQGINRQIRRMCEYLGFKVKKLKRIRVMNIKLDISLGKHRHLTSIELRQLKKMLKKSDKHAEV